MAKSPTIKTGDEVVVIAGTERGKRGKVIGVVQDRQRVIVEGVKLTKRHQKKTRENPNGAIVEREAAIHRSNVVLASVYDSKPQRGAKKAA